MTVVILCHDMIFRTKIESTARSLGCAIAPNVKSIDDEPALVFIDLDSAWPAAEKVVEALSRKRLVRIVAFGSHMRADLFKEARAAGVSEVMARSAFVTKLPELLSAAAPD